MARQVASCALACGCILLTGCNLFNQEKCPEQKEVDEQLEEASNAATQLLDDSCEDDCKCKAAEKMLAIFGSLDKKCASTVKAVIDAGTTFEKIKDWTTAAAEVAKLDQCKKSEDNCPEQKEVDEQLVKAKNAGEQMAEENEESCDSACKCNAAGEFVTIFDSLILECESTQKAVTDAEATIDEINDMYSAAEDILKLDECTCPEQKQVDEQLVEAKNAGEQMAEENEESCDTACKCNAAGVFVTIFDSLKPYCESTQKALSDAEATIDEINDMYSAAEDILKLDECTCPEQKQVDEQLVKAMNAGEQMAEENEESCDSACKCIAADEFVTIFDSLKPYCESTQKALSDAGATIDDINDMYSAAEDILKLDECQKSEFV